MCACAWIALKIRKFWIKSTVWIQEVWKQTICVVILWLYPTCMSMKRTLLGINSSLNMTSGSKQQKSAVMLELNCSLNIRSESKHSKKSAVMLGLNCSLNMGSDSKHSNKQQLWCMLGLNYCLNLRKDFILITDIATIISYAEIDILYEHYLLEVVL